MAVCRGGTAYRRTGIADSSSQLTKELNQFYHDYSILSADTEEEKALRLVLAANVAKTLYNGMSLLGIEMPERM